MNTLVSAIFKFCTTKNLYKYYIFSKTAKIVCGIDKYQLPSPEDLSPFVTVATML